METKTKQTAVEWLFDSINTELIKWSQGEISAQAYGINVTRIKEQAKQMEKEQMRQAYIADLPHVSNKDAENYYYETYADQEQGRKA